MTRKTLLIAFAAVVALLVAACGPAGSATPAPTTTTTPAPGNTPGYSNVTPAEARAIIEGDPTVVVLDVRTQVEYDAGHLNNAVLIPVDELAGRLSELDRSRDKTIVVYCRTGQRSARASGILAANGFTKVYNMTGGILAWQEAGFPVTAPMGVGLCCGAPEGRTIVHA